MRHAPDPRTAHDTPTFLQLSISTRTALCSPALTGTQRLVVIAASGRLRRTYLSGLSSALLLLVCSPLDAQTSTLVVVVRDLRSGRPIPGALASLRDHLRVVHSALTDGQGRAQIVARRNERFSLSVERVGFVTDSSTDLTLSDSLETHTVFVSSGVVSLAGLAVRGDRECESSAGDGATALVWNEARKALEASLATPAGSTRSVLTSRRYVRDLSPSLRVQREHIEPGRASDNSFASAAASDLSANGFVRDSGGRALFFAPDAEVLLSPEFASDHCFSIARKRQADTALVGLAFQPVPRRSRPDVRGTLWLTERDATLRTLEFGYVHLPDSLDHARVGGQVDFVRLPDGRWVVTRWFIRTPRLGYVSASRVSMLDVSRRLELIGYLEEGGMVDLAPRTERSDRRRADAWVSGIVFDSSQSRPLAGAKVQLDGTETIGTTAADGSFVVRTSLSGEYVLSVTHERLTQIGQPSLRRVLTLTTGDTAFVQLGLPSINTVRDRLCGAEQNSTGVLVLGQLRDSVSRRPVASASVVARWARPLYLRHGTLTGVGMDSSFVQTTSDSAGFFFVCGVPPSTTLALSAHSGLSSAQVRRPLDLRSTTAHIEQVLFLAPTNELPGTLRVIVRTPEPQSASFAPSVFLPWLARSLVPRASGLFADDTLPRGEQLISVRAIGFEPLERVVSIVAGDTTTFHATLVPIATTLTAVEVEASEGRSTFDRHRSSNTGGAFVDRVALDAREGQPLSSVLRLMAPGVRTQRLSTGGSALVSARDLASVGGRRSCFAQVYVDGVKIFGQSQLAPSSPPPSIDSYAVNTLEGVEVYNGPATTPHEYSGPDAECGTIVLWTRRGES